MNIVEIISILVILIGGISIYTYRQSRKELTGQNRKLLIDRKYQICIGCLKSDDKPKFFDGKTWWHDECYITTLKGEEEK